LVQLLFGWDLDLIDKIGVEICLGVLWTFVEKEDNFLSFLTGSNALLVCGGHVFVPQHVHYQAVEKGKELLHRLGVGVALAVEQLDQQFVLEAAVQGEVNHGVT